MCVNSEQASPFSLATDPCYRLLPAAVAGGEREDFASRGLLLAASGERDNDTHGPPSSHRVCGASAVVGVKPRVLPVVCLCVPASPV